MLTAHSYHLRGLSWLAPGRVARSEPVAAQHTDGTTGDIDSSEDRHLDTPGTPLQRFSARALRCGAMSTLRSIDWRGQSFRYSWLPTEHRTASLVPVPGRVPLSVDSVVGCVARLRAEGADAIVTAAVPADCSIAFTMAGFTPIETLVVLTLDPADLRLRSPEQPVKVRAVRPWEVDLVLSLDQAAFEPKWWLHRSGYDEAVAATPRTRARVVALPAWPKAAAIDAYLLSGFAGTQGFIQRLAVRPGSEGRGYARSLIEDAVRWMQQGGVTTISVNTHRENQRALALYERIGFTHASAGLTIWRTDLSSTTCA